jgi:hypothetical protein
MALRIDVTELSCGMEMETLRGRECDMGTPASSEIEIEIGDVRLLKITPPLARQQLGGGKYGK